MGLGTAWEAIKVNRPVLVVATAQALDLGSLAAVLAVAPVAGELNPLVRVLLGVGGIAAVALYKALWVGAVAVCARWLPTGGLAILTVILVIASAANLFTLLMLRVIG